MYVCIHYIYPRIAHPLQMMGEPRSPGDGSAEVMVKLDNGGVARGDNGGVVRGDNGGVVRGVARGEGGVVRGDGGVVRGEGDTDSPRSQRTTPHLHLNQGHSGAVSPQSYTPSPLGDHTGTLSSTPSSSPQSPHSATGQLTFQKTDRHGFTIASSQYTDPDAEAKVNQGSGGGGDLHSEKLRNRELKWLKMFSFWEMTINKNFNMVSIALGLSYAHTHTHTRTYTYTHAHIHVYTSMWLEVRQVNVRF